MENKTLYIATCHPYDTCEVHSNYSIGVYNNIDAARAACLLHSEQNINEYYMDQGYYINNPEWKKEDENILAITVMNDGYYNSFIDYTIEPFILNAMPKKEGN